MLYLSSATGQGICGQRSADLDHILTFYFDSATKHVQYVRVSMPRCHCCDNCYADVAQGCRKGKRECQYPDTSSSSRSTRRDSRQKGATGDSPSSPSGDELEGDDKQGLSAIPDDDEDLDTDDMEPSSAASEPRLNSDASSWSQSRSQTASGEPSTAASRPPRPQPSRTQSRQSVHSKVFQDTKFSALTKEDKSYLKYHQDRLSHHHYAFKYDAGDFLKTTFLEIAMNDSSQALLYSIIAFSAYHQSVEKGDLRISIFLQYYNKSIVLLHQSLQKKKPGIATLLTILQLATIEVSEKRGNSLELY